MNGLLTLRSFERHPARTLSAIGLVFALAYVGALTFFPRTQGRVIDGDGIQYYAYLRSLVLDADLDFTNDYQLLYAPSEDGAQNIWLTSLTPRGRPTNVMSIGPAVLWTPFFLVVCAIVSGLRLIGLAIPMDGVAAPFPLSVGVAGVFYATAGAYLCVRACRLLFQAEAAFWAGLIAWLATPAVYYSVISPTYSHATSLFAGALFTYVWLRSRGEFSLRRYVWLGILAGLAALVRWQDIIFLLLPAIEVMHAVMTGQLRMQRAFTFGVVLGTATALALLPQLLAWYAIYGELLLMPQGQGFMRWTQPELLAVLFSSNHGLFTWTPAVLVAVAGLILLIRRDALAGSSALAVVFVAVYVNAAVADWWAGEAFGARRFIGYTVLFALGLAAVLSLDFWQQRPTLRRWVAAGVVTYNLLFLLQYQLAMRGFQALAPYPTTMQQILFDRLVLPWHLLRAWLF